MSETNISLYEEREVDREQFIVHDLASADWAVAKVCSAQQRIAENNAYVAELKRQLDERLAEMNREHERTIDFMTGVLYPWVHAEVDGQKSNTIKLPAGDAQIRKQPDRVDVINEEEAIKWCEENAPDAIIVTRSLSKTELKRLMKTQDVPGIASIPGFSKLYIKGVTPDAETN